MAKAFWVIVRSINDSAVRPDLPPLASVSFTNPGDIYILDQPPSAGANHRHTMIGSFGIPSFNVSSKHTHIALRHGALYQQTMIKDPTDTQVDHTHPDTEIPKFFFLFLVCSDADHDVLIAAPHNLRPIAYATFDSDGKPAALEDVGAWSAANKTAIDSLILQQLGIQLPAQIDRGKRLVAFLLSSLLARRQDNEMGIRGS